LVPHLIWGIYVKKTFISAAAILAFAASAHADELTDIQAQAKQIREQNATMTKRLADLEKRQKALEAKPTINPVDAMAADLPYKAAVKAKPAENDDICIKGICVYGNFDMGLTYIQHSAPFSPEAGGPLGTLVSKNGGQGSYFGVGANQLSTSFIGLRGKQEIGDNLYAVFNLQTLFNPASGLSANGPGSIAQNNGAPIGFQATARRSTARSRWAASRRCRRTSSSTMTRSRVQTRGHSSPSRVRTAAAATPKTASSTTRSSIA
jgi:hypothetical protein